MQGRRFEGEIKKAATGLFFSFSEEPDCQRHKDYHSDDDGPFGLLLAHNWVIGELNLEYPCFKLMKMRVVICSPDSFRQQSPGIQGIDQCVYP